MDAIGIPGDDARPILERYGLDVVKINILSTVKSVKIDPEDVVSYTSKPGIFKGDMGIPVSDMVIALEQLLDHRLLQIIDDQGFGQLMECVDCEQPFTWCRRGDRFAYPGAVEFTWGGAGLYHLAYEALKGESMEEFFALIDPATDGRLSWLLQGDHESDSLIFLGSSEMVMTRGMPSAGIEPSSVVRVGRRQQLWRDYWWRPPQPMWFGVARREN